MGERLVPAHATSRETIPPAARPGDEFAKILQKPANPWPKPCDGVQLLSAPFGGVQRRLPLHFGPAPECDDPPDQLDDPERPRALQEAVGRPQPAGDGEGQHEPAAAVLEPIGDEHRCDSEEAEGRQAVHGSGRLSASRAAWLSTAIWVLSASRPSSFASGRM